jgi:hypothetical protein
MVVKKFIIICFLGVKKKKGRGEGGGGGGVVVVVRGEVHLFANHSASSSMSKVHVIEMADKCLGILLRQLFQ